MKSEAQLKEKIKSLENQKVDIQKLMEEADINGNKSGYSSLHHTWSRIIGSLAHLKWVLA